MGHKPPGPYRDYQGCWHCSQSYTGQCTAFCSLWTNKPSAGQSLRTCDSWCVSSFWAMPVFSQLCTALAGREYRDSSFGLHPCLAILTSTSGHWQTDGEYLKSSRQTDALTHLYLGHAMIAKPQHNGQLYLATVAKNKAQESSFQTLSIMLLSFGFHLFCPRF